MPATMVGRKNSIKFVPSIIFFIHKLPSSSNDVFRPFVEGTFPQRVIHTDWLTASTTGAKVILMVRNKRPYMSKTHLHGASGKVTNLSAIFGARKMNILMDDTVYPN